MNIATIATTKNKKFSQTDNKYLVWPIRVAMPAMIGLASCHSTATLSLQTNAILDNLLSNNTLYWARYNRSLNSNSAVSDCNSDNFPVKATLHNNCETLTEHPVELSGCICYVITYSDFDINRHKNIQSRMEWRSSCGP